MEQLKMPKRRSSQFNHDVGGDLVERFNHCVPEGMSRREAAIRMLTVFTENPSLFLSGASNSVKATTESSTSLGGVVGEILDARHYDFSGYIEGANTLYLRASDFSVFCHVYLHRHYLLNRLFNPKLSTFIVLDQQFIENNWKIGDYHAEVIEGVLRIATNAFNAPAQSRGTFKIAFSRGEMFLPSFALVADDIAFSSGLSNVVFFSVLKLARNPTGHDEHGYLLEKFRSFFRDLPQDQLAFDTSSGIQPTP
jgi:hypothetical protein